MFNLLTANKCGLNHKNLFFLFVFYPGYTLMPGKLGDLINGAPVHW